MKKGKKFVIATEGATTDGRNISRDWISQMAKNYNPKVYGARINLEHFRGIMPDGPFKAYGDVISLSTVETDGKLQLVAELSPTDELIAFNKQRQKIYTSMEVDPDFADTGEAYLVGLAVTDSPASLGTEMLAFSAKAKVNPLAERKTSPDNLFSAAVETALDFSEEDDSKPSLLETIKQRFAELRKKQGADFNDLRKDVEESIVELANQIPNSSGFVPVETFNTLKDEFDGLTEQFKALKDKLEETPEKRSFHRKPATGDNGDNEIDC